MTTVVREHGAPPVPSTELERALAGSDAMVRVVTLGPGGLRRSRRGSLAKDVSRESDVPLLLVGPRCDVSSALDRPGPILVFVDGSDSSESVVAAGADWAGRLDRDIALETVVHPMEDRSAAEVEAMLSSLRRPLDRTGRSVAVGDLVRASEADALVELAEDEGCSLIVLARSARSRWERLLRGDTIVDLLARVPCPVLVVPVGNEGSGCLVPSST